MVKFSTLLAAFLASAAAVAYKIPDGLPDGFYQIEINDHGEEVTKNITDLISRSITYGASDDDAPSLAKRATAWPPRAAANCPNTRWFPQNDFYNGAFNTFWHLCRSYPSVGANPLDGIFSKSGQAVAYMCNYKDGVPCKTTEFEDAVGWASGHCTGRSNGWMQPGYVSAPEWRKSYGYGHKDDLFCLQ